MAKAKKLSKKAIKQELAQPDEFISRGEQALQHLVDNRNRYLMVLGGLVAILVIVNIIGYFIDSKNEAISKAFAEALEVYNAEVVESEEDAGGGEKSPDKLTFATSGEKHTAAVVKLRAMTNDHGSSSYGNVARFYLANSLFMLKQYDKALTTYQEFLETGGESVDQFQFLAYHNIAQCYDSKGELEKAIEAYQTILAMEGDAWKDEANFRIAQIYKRQGKIQESIKLLLELQEKYPDSSLKPSVDKLLLAIRGPVPEPEEKPKEDAEKNEKAVKEGEGD